MATPADTISASGTIDFTSAPWPDMLQRCADSANKQARAAALAAGFPNRAITASRNWFQANAPTWDAIVGDNRKAQAMIIASRGNPRMPCEPLCSKSNSSRPFRDCLVLANHFLSACANCQIRDWRARCNHNRTSHPPNPA